MRLRQGAQRVFLSTTLFALFAGATFEWEFWLLFIALASVTLLLYTPEIQEWWRARHEGRCECRKCGYNLTGNVSGLCPECGHWIDQRMTGNYH